eukprot:80772-Rhodomonas_salina.2
MFRELTRRLRHTQVRTTVNEDIAQRILLPQTDDGTRMVTASFDLHLKVCVRSSLAVGRVELRIGEGRGVPWDGLPAGG